MRIRTIKPDIWRSEDFTSLSDFGQLMFIGLINYVDDNGVGRYNLVDFAADVFASRLAEDASELLPKISEVFGNLSARGMVQIYEAEAMGKTGKFVYLTNWDRHQRISHPMKSRFPRPSNDSTESRKTSEDYGNLPKPTENYSQEEGKSGRREEGKSGRVRGPLPDGTDPDPSPQSSDAEADTPTTRTSDGKGKTPSPKRKNPQKENRPWRYKTRRQIPDGWQPTEANRKLAAERGIDCDELAARFRDWCEANGAAYKDFAAAFGVWIRREKTNRPAAQSPSRTQSNNDSNADVQRRMGELDRMLGLTASGGERSNR